MSLSVYDLENNLNLALDKWGRDAVCEGIEWVVGEVYIWMNLNHRFLTICQQNLIIALLNTHTYTHK